MIDLLIECTPTSLHVDAMEAQESPPQYHDSDPKRRVELEACFWILSLASSWKSVLYTFSDQLYAEVADAPIASSLLQFAYEAQAFHPDEYRIPDPQQRPSIAPLTALGLKHKDSVHVADAIALGCSHLLTNDRRLRNKSNVLFRRWGLHCRRPSEFVTESVRDHLAPWPTTVPWPWELWPGVTSVDDVVPDVRAL